jgi:hypothetical protein
MEKHKFKVGDKVIASGDISGCAYITKNKEYEVVGLDFMNGCNSNCAIRIVSDRGKIDSYMEYRFTLFEKELTLEEQVKLAKSYIGKNVESTDGKYSGLADTVEVVVDRTFLTGKNSSAWVVEYFDKHGFVVIVKSNNYWTIPVTRLKLVEFTEFKLNDEYTAKIYDDKVIVGCQTFKIETIKELAKLLK